jgi:hypothetical protein
VLARVKAPLTRSGVRLEAPACLRATGESRARTDEHRVEPMTLRPCCRPDPAFDGGHDLAVNVLSRGGIAVEQVLGVLQFSDPALFRFLEIHTPPTRARTRAFRLFVERIAGCTEQSSDIAEGPIAATWDWALPLSMEELMLLWTGDDFVRRLSRSRRPRTRARRLVALVSRAPATRLRAPNTSAATGAAFARGAVAGAVATGLLMYYGDPQSGRRRRVLLRDKTAHTLREARAGFAAARRDLAHRGRGLVAAAQHRLEQDGAADDVIVQRVRTALGRVVSHPHALEVDSRDGRVELRGPILRTELHRVLSRAAAVRGVAGVDNALDVYERGEHVPALQGGVARKQRFELLQEHWAPGPRLLAFGAGLSLLGAAAVVPASALRWPLVLGGVGLAARSATNTPAKSLFGLRLPLLTRRASSTEHPESEATSQGGAER